MSDAAWTPAKPPPPWMKRSKAACWASLRISPVVDMKTTTSKVARLASVNWAASSVATTSKSLAVPSAWIAAMPCGIESWRKPPVLENTSTRSSAGASTVIEPVMPVCSVHRNVYVPTVLKVRCDRRAVRAARFVDRPVRTGAT